MSWLVHFTNGQWRRYWKEPHEIRAIARRLGWTIRTMTKEY